MKNVEGNDEQDKEHEAWCCNMIGMYESHENMKHGWHEKRGVESRAGGGWAQLPLTDLQTK